MEALLEAAAAFDVEASIVSVLMLACDAVVALVDWIAALAR